MGLTQKRREDGKQNKIKSIKIGNKKISDGTDDDIAAALGKLKARPSRQVK